MISSIVSRTEPRWNDWCIYTLTEVERSRNDVLTVWHPKHNPSSVIIKLQQRPTRLFCHYRRLQDKMQKLMWSMRPPDNARDRHYSWKRVEHWDLVNKGIDWAQINTGGKCALNGSNVAFDILHNRIIEFESFRASGHILPLALLNLCPSRTSYIDELMDGCWQS